MSPRSSLLVIVLFLAVGLAPLAWAHGPDGTPNESDNVAPSARSGYTGPGRDPYVNFYDGAWVYGGVSASPLGNQQPKDLKGSGDWIVWTDAASNDIFAYNIPAGTGQYVTRDNYLQRSPAISGGTIVWEDYRSKQHADVWAYFIETGESRRLSSGPGNHVHPSIDGPIVAWEDDRNKNGDIYGYDLRNQTEFPIFVGPDRESDPLVLGDMVYFRTYRFNVWDILAVNLTTGEQRQITSDLPINGAPFTNGKSVFFLTQYFTAWTLDTYDPAQDRIVHLPLKFLDTTSTPISGDRLVTTVNDAGYRQVVAENLTSGVSTHVSGNLFLTSDPWFQGSTAYAPVKTPNGTTLLAMDLSPFAFTSPPTLVITSPGSGTAWLQPMSVSGVLGLPGEWSQPATFTYRLDGGLPVAIPFAERFKFTVDPTGFDAGRHSLTIRASFREGPPVEKTILLVVPAPNSAIDVAKAGTAHDRARVLGAINAYVVKNPASWFIFAITFLLLVILVLRLWIVIRPKFRRSTIEYVPQSDNG